MSHGWVGPTYRDVTGNDRPVRCPQCRRPVAPDMLRPATGLPAEVRGRWRRPAALYACDACHETLIRERHVSRADLARLHGAPDALALVLEAKRPGTSRGAGIHEAIQARRSRGEP